jgi:hypothetical protein
MKKLLSIAAVGVMLLASSNSAFAENAVSKMANTKGGKSVAQCAKEMDKGVSECAKLPECQDGM